MSKLLSFDQWLSENGMIWFICWITTWMWVIKLMFAVDIIFAIQKSFGSMTVTWMRLIAIINFCGSLMSKLWTLFHSTLHDSSWVRRLYRPFDRSNAFLSNQLMFFLEGCIDNNQLVLIKLIPYIFSQYGLRKQQINFLLEVWFY